MYHIIGIMTGNSLDAADAVLTCFDGDKITDIAGYTLPYPAELRADFLTLRAYLSADMDMDTFIKTPLFLKTHEAYIRLIAQAVSALLQKTGFKAADITAIGFHGQTVDFCGPSVAGHAKIRPYNTQVGSGQKLADLTGIPVIYDFRSDDVMAGGEGAPLAPTHNKNLAKAYHIKHAVFFNAGNTSNLALVHQDEVIGWDAGPFNELVDKMVRLHKNESCDFDGRYGLKGTVQPDLLRRLFLSAAVTGSGDNYLLLPPPKASDPKWYRFLDELKNPADFENKLRTVEYFSAYVAVHTLKYVPPEMKIPTNFILFGGGWYNPVCKEAFENLLIGEGFILPEHTADFAQIRQRLHGAPKIWISRMGQYMEARIFADLARFYLENKPWMSSLSDTRTPVRLGRMRYPHAGPIDDYISRASKGWQDKLPRNKGIK
ncbi:MAG: anhydro-N-acetylmuramic acid kinase [Alphaproteobacteria bacterium]